MESEMGDIVDDRADWLVDAVATATQNRMFLRGDPEADQIAIDAIILNGRRAISAAVEAERKACEEIARKWLKTDDILEERDRLRAALKETTDAVNVALQQVESANFLPDWDWLREVRERARAALEGKPNEQD